MRDSAPKGYRLDLRVPFSQKSVAKECGAKWDALKKVWYITDPTLRLKVQQWAPRQPRPPEKARLRTSRQSDSSDPASTLLTTAFLEAAARNRACLQSDSRSEETTLLYAQLPPPKRNPAPMDRARYLRKR